MLAITFFMYPLLWTVTLFFFPLNHNQVVENAQSLVSDIDSGYYLSDEKIINNVDYLLFSMKNRSDSKVVIYTSKAPILSRFSDISYMKINNLETFGAPTVSVRITDTSLTIEKLPLVNGLMILIFATIVWLAGVLILSKRVISLRKTLFNAQAGGNTPDSRD